MKVGTRLREKSTGHVWVFGLDRVWDFFVVRREDDAWIGQLWDDCNQNDFEEIA